MLKTWIGAGAALATLAASATSAHALKIEELKFQEKTEIHEIHVQFNQAQNNWTTATSKPLHLVYDWYLKVKSLTPINSSLSYLTFSVWGVADVGVFYELEETRNNPGIFHPTISWTGTKTFNVPGNSHELAAAAVEKCQALYAEGERPNESHTAYLGVLVARVETQVENYSVAFSKQAGKNANSTVYAVCDEDPTWKEPSKEPTQKPVIAFDHGEMTVHDVELFLSTFSNATTQPNVASTCKMGRILVRLTTNQAGAVNFKLWKQVGNGALTSQSHTIWASHDGAGSFKAEHVEWVSVSTPTYVQAKAVEFVNAGPVNLEAGWKDITLPCAPPGGSGYAQDPGPSDVPLAPPAKYDGELTVADSALAKKNECPRNGQAVFKINSNRSNNVEYRLDCSGGRSWEGTVQMSPNGAGKYQGVAAKTFDVDHTELVGCALKRVKGDNAYLLALGGKQFACAKRAVGTASGDFAPKPGQSDDPPQGQTLNGDFAFIDQGGTKCIRTVQALLTFTSPKTDNIHYSLDCKHGSFSGVAPAVPHPDGGHASAALVSFDVEQTLDTSCTLKTVAPFGAKTHTSKSHLFQCVKRDIEPGAVDLTPQAKPAQHIACAGGMVKDGACQCDLGHKPVQASANVWRCARTAVIAPAAPKADAAPKKTIKKTLSCLGGSVRNGGCACASGFNAIAAGPNAFRCVRTATLPPGKTAAPKPQTPQDKVSKIACSGGSVSSGKCVCPPGKFALATPGKSLSFYCLGQPQIPPPQPAPPAPSGLPKPPGARLVPKQQIACAGGAVRGNRCVCPAGTALRNGACAPAASIQYRMFTPNGTPLRAKPGIR
jgi:hypothetical protein